MQGVQVIWARIQALAGKVPPLLWAAAGAVLVALAAVSWLELAGPDYAVLSEGLSPADGGKVIAQLQKLGIPYQLQAAGNVIMVPAPQLAQARLQLGAAQVPGSDTETAWTQLETAPMTASDLAQNTMAQRALQLSLQQSIQQMHGIASAQVFLAIPADTPFLADQPKPAASVVVDAPQSDAAAQGEAIAKLVAGAVPGMAAKDVTVVTTAGETVYPAGGPLNIGGQFATVAQVEAMAAARIAGLLMPLVGAGNFQTDVSADLDFTQDSIHQIAYGPTHLVAHEISDQSSQTGPSQEAIGIPGALSNEPPGPTGTAPAPPAPSQASTQGNAGGAGTGSGTGAGTGTGTGTGAGPGAAAKGPPPPSKTSTSLDQTFLTDQTESDIVKPAWAVKSVAVSVVLNQAALAKGVTVAEVKAAIAGAFAYPNVSVNVLAAPFLRPEAATAGQPLIAAASPLAHALLEVMAAGALLFGLALPAGRRLANIDVKTVLPPPSPKPMPVVLPPREFPELREQAAENIPRVARLLQNWAEETE